MAVREVTIAKLQQLPESLLQEIDDFIEFITNKHQSKTENNQTPSNISESWDTWFEATESLKIESLEPIGSYQQLLLDKYRQQGLEL